MTDLDTVVDTRNARARLRDECRLVTKTSIVIIVDLGPPDKENSSGPTKRIDMSEVTADGPLASLLGKKKKNIVTVRLPSGERRYKVKTLR